ncbi:MAG: hypothetical protein PHR10_10400 [Sphaerochaetaceae bacterium]|nr:hypothetical protein [Sphaerochaetaceae bacterium]
MSKYEDTMIANANKSLGACYYYEAGVEETHQQRHSKCHNILTGVKMRVMHVFICIFILTFLMGCTHNVPMKSSINEFVLMNIKTSSHQGVNFTYQSNLVGADLPIYGKGKKPSSTIGKHVADETNTLKSMLTEYFTNKFLEIDPNSALAIEVKLDDFWVEYYVIDSSGMQLAKAITGAQNNYMSSANLIVLISLKHNDLVSKKRLSASAESISSGAQTINVIGDSINQVNNKMLMLVNAFLAENGL